jgi:hypothetical protein
VASSLSGVVVDTSVLRKQTEIVQLARTNGLEVRAGPGGFAAGAGGCCAAACTAGSRAARHPSQHM